MADAWSEHENELFYTCYDSAAKTDAVADTAPVQGFLNWLYGNGSLAAHRDGYQPLWWRNDYRFEWDVDLTGLLTGGSNRFTLRLHVPHGPGGMFRRPFLYRAVSQ